MNKNTPDNTVTQDSHPDIILYLKTLKKEINELDNNIIVILINEEGNKVGKMEYTIYRSKLQGVHKILTSYDFKEIEEELNQYRTRKSPIVVIDEYIQKLI